MKAIVIDDNQEHVDTLVNALKQMGCEAVGTVDINAALTNCLGSQPDLVIVDATHRAMPGWKFAFALLYKTLPKRPYLVTLTDLMPENKQAFRKERALCHEFGFDVYISKPITLENLAAWVKEAAPKQS